MAITNHQTTNATPADTPKGLEGNHSLGWKMIAIAVFLGCISLWMNISFGQSLGTDATSKMAMAGEYLAFDLAKLIALTIIGFAWVKRNYAIAAVFAVVFVLTVGFSLISAQSYMASLLHDNKVDQVMNSDAYQDNQNAKRRAQQKVEALAISQAEVNEAKTKVKRLERQVQAATAAYEGYASRNNYPTATRNALSALNMVEAELEQQQAIVSKGSAYHGALSHLDRLESKKFTGGMIAGDSGENAGFSSVAFALGVDVKTFIAKLLLFMAIGSEIITTMFFFYAGHVMGLRVRKYSHTEMMQMQLQLKQEAQEKEAIGLHLHSAIDSTVERQKEARTSVKQETFKEDLEVEAGKEEFKKDLEAFKANFEKERKEDEEGKPQETNQDEHDPYDTETRAKSKQIIKNLKRLDEDTSIEKLDEEDEGHDELSKIYKRQVGTKYNCASCDAEYAAKTTWHKYCANCRRNKNKPFANRKTS